VSVTNRSHASRAGLARGALFFRWVALAWMTAIALGSGDFRRPTLAWGSLLAALVWTVWITARRGRENRRELAIDLALCLWLLLASGLAVPREAVIQGRPFFATGYPLSAALVWATAFGVRGGLVAGAALGCGLIASRPLNGVPLDSLEAPQIQNMMGAVVNYLAAGAAVGLVSRLLANSERAVREASEALMIERERAARLGEREALARQIHDSVLQSLSMVHKKGRELAGASDIPAHEVEKLADVAARQEAELRALILRPPEDVPQGKGSLRRALENLSDRDGVVIDVAVVGSIWLDGHRLQEACAAVKQALDNVSEHADATKVNVFAEEDAGMLTITVRDDGRGFEFDPQRFESERKAGISRSMKGRIEDLGGRMRIRTAPGKGTEVEFRLPLEDAT
jgi:signal transduction histidine kinase